MKKRILIGLLLLVLCGIGVWTADEAEECTSAGRDRNGHGGWRLAPLEEP